MKKIISIILLTFVLIGSVFAVGCGSSEFTVTFNTNGGSVTNGANIEQTVKDATEIVSPNLEKTGYVFNGWDCVISEIKSTTTVNARWTAKNYTVQLEADGGSLNQTSKNFTFGQEIGEMPVPQKEGFRFLYWTYENHLIVGGDNGDALWNIDGENITLTAQYAKLINVQLDPAGGTLTQNSIELALGQKIGELPIPEKSGWQFLGWCYDDYTFVGGDNGDVLWEIDVQGITLVAKYYSFSVNFNLDGGTITNNVNAEQKVNNISEVVIPTVEKTGYIFLGWDKEISEINQDTTVNAQWQAKTYTVQLKADGFTLEYDSFEIDYDEKIGTLPLLEKQGYKFLGWKYGEYTFNGGDNGDVLWKIDAENIVLVAEFAKCYTLKFELSCVLIDSKNTNATFTVDGKSSLDDIIILEGTSLKQLTSQISKPVIENKFRQDYGFSSWKVLINGKETSIGSLSAGDAIADVNGVITLRVSTKSLWAGPF